MNRHARKSQIEHNVSQYSNKLRGFLITASFKEAREFINDKEARRFITDHRRPGAQSESAPEFLDGLKLRSMAAEVLDYWGDFAGAWEVLEPVARDCETAIEKVSREGRTTQRTDQERKVLRQKVWVLLHAGMAEYRKGHLDPAMRLFGLCEAIAERHLVTSDDQAWGTRARVTYSLGLVHRERSDFDEACREFYRSVEYAYRSLETQDPTSKITYLAIAKSLALGLAFIHSQRGRPDLAFPLLLAAKTILQPMGEEVISAYVDLIYANTQRSRSDAETVTEDVIARLHRCYETFKKVHHRLYAARAAYSLGSAYAQRARPDEDLPLSERGKQDLDKAWLLKDDIHLQAEEDKRFGLYEHLLASRIHRRRGELEPAIDRAGTVINSANKQEPVRLDALLARGEALARKGEHAGAARDFAEAEKTAVKNERLRAISLLQLTILQCRLGNDGEAARAMADFEKLKPAVTHNQVKVLEPRARAALTRSRGDLVLRMDDDTLDAGKAQKEVQKFLISWARTRTDKESEAARRLKISRQTLYNWLQK